MQIGEKKIDITMLLITVINILLFCKYLYAHHAYKIVAKGKKVEKKKQMFLY